MDITASGGQPRHFLQPCLLLLLRERPGYGYELAARLRALGVDDDSAVVYRTLRSLERAGAVSSRWREPVSGPARHVYQIAPEGEALLDRWAKGIDETRRILERFQARYVQGATAPAIAVPEHTRH